MCIRWWTIHFDHVILLFYCILLSPIINTNVVVVQTYEMWALSLGFVIDLWTLPVTSVISLYKVYEKLGMCNVYLVYGVMGVTAEQLWLVMWNNVQRQTMNAPYFVWNTGYVKNYKNHVGTKFIGYQLLLALRLYEFWPGQQFSSMHLWL